MIHFTVEGPLDVPCYRCKAAKTITKEEIRRFWTTYSEFGQRRGCYVFAMRAGGGITPTYVGRATKTFKQEVFAPDKLIKYSNVLADCLKGSPVMFLVMSPAKKGKPNISAIERLEEFLIQVAQAANENLLNVQGKKREAFAISGVLRSKRGKPSRAARAFKALLAL